MKNLAKNSAIFACGSIVGIIFGTLGMFLTAIKSDSFRSALAKTISDEIADILYEEKKPQYRNVYHKNRTINYRYHINADDILFNSKEGAESVLNAMRDVASTYGIVTITDLYDIAGLMDNGFSNKSFGWTENELQRACVSRKCDGYYISGIPRARKIA